MSEETPFFTPTAREFPAAEIPQVIYDADPGLVEFYQIAWRLAWKHVYESNAIPVSPYMGEGCGVNKIWIWDTSFMVSFCRYAYGAFPGVQSLDNFYRIMYDRDPADIKIHHLDNPPLFAWAEYNYFQLTGDLERVRRVLLERQYLQKHYHWLETVDLVDQRLPISSADLKWKNEGAGYKWAGCPSGMDNTPRGRGDYASIYWVDALAQQAAAALYIARLAGLLAATDLQKEYQAHYERKKQLLQNYWDAELGTFMDRYADGPGFCRVITPAIYWAMFAEAATPEQAEEMVRFLRDPQKLGGKYPFPSLAVDDPDLAEDGGYWLGGVWLPTAYMTAKALELYGYEELARELTLRLLAQMWNTYRNFEPHTIWECYSPLAELPAKNKRNAWVRRDFCGWSALGPISMLIENVIGIYRLSAVEKKIYWRITHSARQGISNLRVGQDTVSLLAENGRIKATASSNFTLIVNGQEYPLDAPGGEIALA